MTIPANNHSADPAPSSGMRRKRAWDDLEHIQTLAYVMDEMFCIPGTRITVGLDVLVGLIPVAGDILTALTACYIFVVAWRKGVSLRTLFAMLFNIVADFLLGVLPLAGDIMDVFYRANRKNVRLVLRDIKMRKQ